MKSFFTKRKALTAITSLSLIALIVSSTFAWTSLNSSQVNEWRGLGSAKGPGGSLHDDHDNSKDNDPMKDVYVENWGDEALLVRIKLSEYMETGKNAGKFLPPVDGSLVRDPSNNSSPLINGSVLSGGVIDWAAHAPDISVEDCGLGFHTYWSWLMGGSKFYIPATEAEKEAGRQNNSSVLTDASGNVYNASTPGVKETLNAIVITMEDWLNLPSSDHNSYWAVDEDGWAYWAGYLKPGEATGLLLHKVERTNEKIRDDFYYAINVQAQMADMRSPFTSGTSRSGLSAVSPDDFTTWISGVGTEKASNNAIELLRRVYTKAVDEGVFGEDVNSSDVQQNIDIIFNGN